MYELLVEPALDAIVHSRQEAHAPKSVLGVLQQLLSKRLFPILNPIYINILAYGAVLPTVLAQTTDVITNQYIYNSRTSKTTLNERCNGYLLTLLGAVTHLSSL